MSSLFKSPTGRLNEKSLDIPRLDESHNLRHSNIELTNIEDEDDNQVLYDQKTDYRVRNVFRS